jgi:hypothetical protein
MKIGRGLNLVGRLAVMPVRAVSAMWAAVFWHSGSIRLRQVLLHSGLISCNKIFDSIRPSKPPLNLVTVALPNGRHFQQYLKLPQHPRHQINPMGSAILPHLRNRF